MAIRAQAQITINMGGVLAEIFGNAVAGQNLAGERLLALSAAEVPLDAGGLVASGQVEPATGPGEDTLVVYDTPYAARWHEDKALVDSLGRSYPRGANFGNGRKSHYLSDPALQNKSELRAIIAKAAGSASGSNPINLGGV